MITKGLSVGRSIHCRHVLSMLDKWLIGQPMQQVATKNRRKLASSGIVDSSEISRPKTMMIAMLNRVAQQLG